MLRTESIPRSLRRSAAQGCDAIGAECRERFIWLAAGRITAAKNYPNLLRAFSLHAANLLSRLWVAGEGSNREEERMRDLAMEEGFSGSVDWLGLRDDMPAVLDGADAFVLGSAWEGMPLVVAEAMAMEKPVVATDVGGVSELVGDAGAVVPPRTRRRLRQAMLDVMRIVGGAHAIGKAARERIRQHFNMDAKADEWETLYTGCFAPRISRQPNRCAIALSVDSQASTLVLLWLKRRECAAKKGRTLAPAPGVSSVHESLFHKCSRRSLRFFRG